MGILEKHKISCLLEIERRFVSCPARSLLHIFNKASAAYLIIYVNKYLIKQDKDLSTAVTGLPATQFRYLPLTLGTYLFKTLWVLMFC
jgi:hypothetical protein